MKIAENARLRANLHAKHPALLAIKHVTRKRKKRDGSGKRKDKKRRYSLFLPFI